MSEVKRRLGAMSSETGSTGQTGRVSEAGDLPENGRASVETHIARLSEVLASAISSRAVETVQLKSSGLVGRLAAETVTAPAPLPGFDNSQMDGFAVRLQDLTPDDAGAAALPLAGAVAAGSEPAQMPPGAAVAVMTGAPVPEGADLVIPVERTVAGSFEHVELPAEPEQPAHQPRKHRFFGYKAPLLLSTELYQTEPPDSPPETGAAVEFTGLTEEDLAPGRFIRRAGSDVAVGDVLVETGAALTPAHLGVLAACGYTELPVLSRTKVLVLSTGDEIRTPGSELRPGQLYDANSPLIAAVLETFGCTVETARVGTDDPSWFMETLEALVALHHPQVIVTAGGISKGAYEVVRQALNARGVQFGSVAQQPGGPQGWGLIDVESPGRASSPVAVVALPGNPVSCAVSLETLVRPALAAIGPVCPPQRRIRVRVTERLSSPPGLRQFRRVRLTAPDAVETVGGPSSHLLGHLAKADALLELLEDDVEVAPGTERDAILLTERTTYG